MYFRYPPTSNIGADNVVHTRPTSYQENMEKRKSGPSRKLSKYEEFIITLIRLRLAVFTFFLADIFGVSNARVSQIFTTWAIFMYHILTPLFVWPSTPVINFF